MLKKRSASIAAGPTFPRAGRGQRRALTTPFKRAPNNNMGPPWEETTAASALRRRASPARSLMARCASVGLRPRLGGDAPRKRARSGSLRSCAA